MAFLRSCRRRLQSPIWCQGWFRGRVTPFPATPILPRRESSGKIPGLPRLLIFKRAPLRANSREPTAPGEIGKTFSSLSATLRELLAPGYLCTTFIAGDQLLYVCTDTV